MFEQDDKTRRKPWNASFRNNNDRLARRCGRHPPCQLEKALVSSGTLSVEVATVTMMRRCL
jgi:hypothetical protein